MNLLNQVFERVKKVGWEPGAYPGSGIRSLRVGFVTLTAEPQGNSVFTVPDGGRGNLCLRVGMCPDLVIRCQV